MEIKNLLLEYTLSEFRFGYELEAIDKDSTLRGIIKHTGKRPGIDFTVMPTKNVGGRGFEHQSDVMNLTPANINKTMDFLSSLPSSGIYTNKTCGFHVHLSWPNISSLDAFWIIANLAADEQKIKEVLSFNGKTNMFSKEHANPEFLKEIKKILLSKNFVELKKYFSDEQRKTEDRPEGKSRLFRIHPQGTIEWRGPRGFIPNKQGFNTTRAIIKDFFIKLYDLTRWVNSSLSNTEVLGITKKELFEELSKMEKPFEKEIPEIKLAVRRGFDARNMSKEQMIEVLKKYPWLSRCKFSNAIIRIGENGPVFENGYWLDGEFKNGVFEGYWMGGEFKSGKFSAVNKNKYRQEYGKFF